MSDLIERQDAIDRLCKRCNLVSEYAEPCTEKCNNIKILEMMPSAQPEPPEPEELDFVQPHKKIGVQLEIGRAEIIRCKDCKNSEHWYKDRRRCFLWSEDGVSVWDSGFCNYAERRTDDEG
jgi:hypothetical protein